MFAGLRMSGGAERRLAGIERRMSSRDGVLDVVAERARDYQREVFATDGFGEWAPDSLKTVELKGSSRVLVDSGRLMADLTGEPDRDGDVVSVGSSVPYARFVKAGARGAPPRDPSPAPSAARLHGIAEGLLGYLVDGER